MDRKLLDEYVQLVRIEQEEQQRVQMRRKLRRSRNALRVVQGGLERARIIDEDLKRRYGDLLDEVLAVLAYRDPMHFGAPPNDIYLYSIEARRMLDEIVQIASLTDLEAIIYRQFVGAFGADAGSRDRYEKLSEDIWEILQDRRIREMDG